MMPLYRDDLNSRACDVPGCDHTSHSSEMHFAARCHPWVGVKATYQDGCITLRCRRCGQLVCTVAVAQKPESANE
jgi:hypothetical protein